MTLLHVDFISISKDAPTNAVERIVSAATPVTELPQVTAAAVIEAPGFDYDLVIIFELPELSDLEAFGTSPVYATFLQKGVAPLLGAFSGVDVRLEKDGLPATSGYAACLALTAPDETYDWEVREALNDWTGTDSPTALIGLAAGERQRYRGLALCIDSGQAQSAPPEPVEGPGGSFGSTLIRGRIRPLP